MTGGVAVTGMAVLTGFADDLDGYASVLRNGTGAATGRMSDFSVRAWAHRHLGGAAEDDTLRLVRAAGHAELPARTAACVAVAATRAAGVGEEELAEAALLVAGNNLALAYQARALTAYDGGTGRVRAGHVLAHLDTDAIGTVSQATGVRGEGWTVGGASASGALALIQATRLLTAGFAERCLVVGPVCELSPLELAAFAVSGAMAGEGSGMCRPFDRARSGFVYGHGAAAVLLERAEVAGDRRIAEVAGYGGRLDGRRGTEPDPAGQARAMRGALEMGGAGPDDVDLVNAHATGSVRGDEAEAASLVAVFGSADPVVNGTKALIGHTMTCAGLLEFIGVVLQMRGGFVHGNPRLREPLEARLTFAGRDACPATVRLALSNSFAFSGINASLLVKA